MVNNPTGPAPMIMMSVLIMVVCKWCKDTDSFQEIDSVFEQNDDLFPYPATADAEGFYSGINKKLSGDDLIVHFLKS